MKRISTSCRASGFSLVEITVAIGIFAFVVVGIIGMFPTALRLRSESALETRAVMIAEELFAAARASTNFPMVWGVRDGPTGAYLSPPEDITAAPVVVGYPANTSVPFFLASTHRSAASGTPDSFWEGTVPPGAAANEIFALARLSAQKVTNNLYQVTVEVRAPASAPLARSQPMVFTTYHYAP